jgi:hypothetical protein
LLGLPRSEERILPIKSRRASAFFSFLKKAMCDYFGLL